MELKPRPAEWRKIVGWPYSVADDGKVRNDRNGHVLKQHQMPKGYMSVLLCNEGNCQYRTVHRLVAEAFIPNPEHKPQVNHKDGNKANNHVSNLEWATNSENQLHSCWVLGKMPPDENVVAMYTKASEANKKPVRCVETGEVFGSVKEAAEKAGVSRFAVANAANGKQHISGGYHWEYVRRVGEGEKE